MMYFNIELLFLRDQGSNTLLHIIKNIGESYVFVKIDKKTLKWFKCVCITVKYSTIGNMFCFNRDM